MLSVSPARFGLIYVAATVLIGIWLLLVPAMRLVQSREGTLAARLFDSASYYPLANFTLIGMFLGSQMLLTA